MLSAFASGYCGGLRNSGNAANKALSQASDGKPVGVEPGEISSQL